MQTKKIKISSEIVYLLGTVLMAFSVAMITTTNFGVSMIVAPAYIISEKLSFLTFGQGEYLVQGILLIIFCILMKRVKVMYLASFVTGLIYGAVLDLWRIIIPHFNPAIHAPGTLPFWLRIVYFILGTLITAASVAMMFKTYIYPQIYDFFVKGVVEKFNLDLTKFKLCYDITFLLSATALTLILFHRFVGVGVGTLVTALVNGFLIGWFSKLYDKHLDVKPSFPKLAEKFSIQ